MKTEKIKKEFIIPYINTDGVYSWWEDEPAISFYDIKNMLDIDLLKFKKIGSSILINAKYNVTLNFKLHLIEKENIKEVI